MVHLDYVHISEGLAMSRLYKRNFKKYGLAEGMTECEYMDRYEYEYGDGEWNHPHFIPGVFIAMAQRYRWRQWDGQKTNRSSKNISKKNKVNNATPIWQILLTDGPNDNMHAHVYTTQVPPYIINYFETTGKSHLPPTPANNKKRGRVDHEGVGAGRDMPFDFRIRHTRVSYDPNDTFRERLREAITYSRGGFL